MKRLYMALGMALMVFPASLLADCTDPPMSGTYTINSAQTTSGTNYASFSAFFDELECRGVNGAVVANVSSTSGPYLERVVVDEITGASSTNTITVNGNGRVLEFEATASAERTTLVLDGADWITFNNLEIKATGASFGWAVQLTNGANHNTFSNCVFETNSTAATTNFAGVVISNGAISAIGAGANGSYNTFQDNTFIGGYYGASIHGTSAANMEVGNRFIDNTFENFHFYGIYARSQDSLEIIGNDLSREDKTASTTVHGLSFATGMQNARIIGNRIHDLYPNHQAATTQSYPIYMTGATGATGAENILANNAIYNITHQGLVYGIQMFGAANNHWLIYHNSIVFDEETASTLSETRGISFTGAQADVEVKNNLFYSNRGSSIQYFIHAPSTAVLDIDNNAYYSPTIDQINVNFGHFGQDLATFADWQAINSNAFDQNGRFVVFGLTDVENGNLEPTLPTINDMGVNLSALVSEDINGNPRSATPDPGAWEFSPAAGTDMKALAFTSPGSGTCPGTLSVDVDLTNLGSDVPTNVYISWRINGVAQPQYVATGNFAAGNIENVSIGSFTAAANTAYDIVVTIDSVSPGDDIDPANNEIELIGYMPGISGSYTVDQNQASSATNFESLSELAEVLRNGICGPVTVDVVANSGPYTEQVAFGVIPNASSSNTITINGNGNELSYLSTNTAERYTLALQGTSHLTIDDLVIYAQGSASGEFGWGIWITGGSDHNTISNCRIEVDTLANAVADFGGIVMSSSPVSPTTAGETSSYNVIKDNFVKGGHNGIVIMGNSASALSKSNQITGNFVTHFRSSGIYVTSQDSLLVKGNEMTRGNRDMGSGNFLFYGIFMSNGLNNARIEGNVIRNSCDNCGSVTGIQRGIYGTQVAGSAGNENYMVNNVIHDLNGSGTVHYINVLNSDYWKYYHNIIAMVETNLPAQPIAYGMNLTGAANALSNVEIKNNIMTITRPGFDVYGYYFQSLDNGADIDYNGVHALNGYIGGSASDSYEDFADWQANTNFDANSVNVPPFYTDPANGNYIPRIVHYVGAGDDLSASVPEDINGLPRSSTPALGAYEFVAQSCLGAYNFTVDSLHPYGVYMNWESDESDWEIQWGPQGFDPASNGGNFVGPTGSKTAVSVDSMIPDVCYDLYVRDLCGSDVSPWTGPLSVCTPRDYDIAPAQLLTPILRQCGDTAIEVSVLVENRGYFDADSFTVDVNITGPGTHNLSVAYNGTLAAYDSDSIVVGVFNEPYGGTFNFEIIVNWNDDRFAANDRITLSREIRDGWEYPVFATADTICEPTDVTLWTDTAYADEPKIWYDENDAVIGSGDSLTLTNVSQTTLVKVGLDGDPITTFFVGLPDTSAGAATNIVQDPFFYQIAFRSFEDLLFKSVKIYPEQSGSLTMRLLNASGAQLDSKPFTVNISSPYEEVQLDLDFDLNPGNYQIVCASSTVGRMKANGTGSVVYPYGDSTVLVITGASALGFNTSYFFYYDWELIAEGCERPIKEFTILMQDPPVADFTDNHGTVTADQNGFEVFFDGTASGADNYEWDFGDGNNGIGDTVSHNYTANGTYTVTLIVSNNCGRDTISSDVVVTGVSVTDHPLASSLRIYPNPTDGRFALSFNKENAGDLTVELVDIAGKTIMTEAFRAFSGEFYRDYQMSNLAAGVYMLRINTAEGRVVKRVIIQ